MGKSEVATDGKLKTNTEKKVYQVSVNSSDKDEKPIFLVLAAESPQDALRRVIASLDGWDALYK